MGPRLVEVVGVGRGEVVGDCLSARFDELVSVETIQSDAGVCPAGDLVPEIAMLCGEGDRPDAAVGVEAEIPLGPIGARVEQDGAIGLRIWASLTLAEHGEHLPLQRVDSRLGQVVVVPPIYQPPIMPLGRLDRALGPRPLRRTEQVEVRPVEVDVRVAVECHLRERALRRELGDAGSQQLLGSDLQDLGGVDLHVCLLGADAARFEELAEVLDPGPRRLVSQVGRFEAVVSGDEPHRPGSVAWVVVVMAPSASISTSTQPPTPSVDTT